MKRYLPIMLVLSILSFTALSCGGGKEPDTPEKPETTAISVSPTSLSFDYGGTTTYFVSVTAGGSWTATASESWLSVSPASGNGNASITVSASENTSTSERSGSVTISGSSSSASVTVTQATGYEPSIVPNPAAFDGTKRAGTTYQLLVYSFADSDGDGVGDFQGIINKLDYLDELGVTGLWLSPIHPSSSYHGYDVKDYSTVNPKYGTEADFQNLVAQAHARGIEIYLDFVLNHSSYEHPWFVSAYSSEDSEYRDFYTFSKNPAADIAAGNIPMIATEGARGYDAGQWFTVPNAQAGASGRYHFLLDWSNSSAPTVTVTESSAEAQTSNPDTSVQKYIYFGNGTIYRFYQTGSNTYELTIDFESSWGFLIRTSTTTWDGGTKYGGTSSSQTITLGEAFTLNNTEAADITFSDSWKYHSHFGTSWFADFNYGEAENASESGAFKALLADAEKWIAMGVDGLRLDAVKHIYHNASSTENPTFLRQWYDACNAAYKNAGHSGDMYMVGEVFDEATVAAPYFAGLPSCFEFSYWWRLADVLNRQSAYSFVSNILSYQARYAAYRSDWIESTKLSNHDETRAASTLGKSIAKEKQAAAFLLTSPGKPFIYQGEELGYWGTQDNGDEYVRTPLMWDKAGADLATEGVGGKVDRSMLTSSISVESQEEDSESLLNVYKSFSRLRNTYPALATGTMTAHSSYNSSSYPTIACWYMTSGSERMLVVHNVATSASKTLSFTDDLSSPVALLGTASTAKDGGTWTLTIGPNSSVVFKL